MTTDRHGVIGQQDRQKGIPADNLRLSDRIKRASKTNTKGSSIGTLISPLLRQRRSITSEPSKSLCYLAGGRGTSSSSLSASKLIFVLGSKEPTPKKGKKELALQPISKCPEKVRHSLRNHGLGRA